jgi:chromate transporter
MKKHPSPGLQATQGEPPPDALPQQGPSFDEALRFWWRLGFISFGGPAGQIAIMHRELVERFRWISERRFLHALNYCMMLPGPEAQQLATYIGWLMHGTRGGIAAGALFVLPSLFILVALSWVYVSYGEVPAVAALLHGVKPAVVAIVLAAAWRIGTRTLRHPLLWLIAAAALIAISVASLPFPMVIGGAALAGVIGGRFVPGAFRAPEHAAGAAPEASVIDDDSATPAHARFSPRRFAWIVAIFLAIWAGAVGVLAAVFGFDGDYVHMGWFFTKAALLTFGGAYAVLPYVLQGAVEQNAWLSATQMIDGLALGETTPGPLIMVVAFVGFLGGWTKQLLGGDALLAAAVVGACVATFFTFLPSFLFILAGGPLVERTRGHLKLTAPLTAITAAVVGVIINLAIYFAWRVFWPESTAAAPFSGRFDVASVAIAVLATMALVSGRAGVIAVIAASALAGVGLWAAGYGAV